MFEERFEQCKNDLTLTMLSNGIEQSIVDEYVDKYYQKFVESGGFVYGARDDLKSLLGLKYSDEIYNCIYLAVEKYRLTFSERVHYELDKDKSELTSEEAEMRKADLLALNEVESICDGTSNCKPIEDQWDLFYVLVEGLDPENFEFCGKPRVTKEEVAQFRELGKKFNMQTDVVNRYIDLILAGTPSARAQKIVSIENIIAERRLKQKKILTSSFSDGRAFSRCAVTNIVNEDKE